MLFGKTYTVYLRYELDDLREGKAKCDVEARFMSNDEIIAKAKHKLEAEIRHRYNTGIARYLSADVL